MIPDLVLTDEFKHALGILDAGGGLFLTGRAGTGKSTLIRRFMATTDRRLVVAAPTGIAALNVDGYTIHRLFGFTTTTGLDDVRHGSYKPGRFARTLATLETLIIDEASMVRADQLDMVAAALERFGPAPGTPFGGVQVVLVGDLYQLPPVVPDGEAAFLAARYDSPYFFSADAFDPGRFPTVSLTTVFRQLGDDRLTSTLNAIREGVLLEHTRAELNERADAGFVPPEDEFWLTVAPTNRIVTSRNRQRLEQLPGEEHASLARESGDLSLFDPPVERRVTYKVGAQVMLLTNDPADRWANGSLGRITAVAPGSADVVSVELRDGTTVDVGPHTWEATRPVVEGGSLRHEVVGTYTQLPFKLAWATTIHKSQGQTLDRLVVDLSGGTFDYGQVYVALSRCTSLEGLVLTRPLLAKDLKTDRRVARFLHAATAQQREWRYCAVSVLTVGDEGRMSRPRPVEIGVAFDDGTSLSTLVNPQRDLGSARTDFGISVHDVVLAPTLDEAWSVIAPLVAGCTPVGVGTDEALGLVDFELKRLGRVEPLPLGVELESADLRPAERDAMSTGTAAARARASLRAHERLAMHDTSATAFAMCDDAPSTSYLLTREPATEVPRPADSPQLSALLDVSRTLSAVVLGTVATEAQETVTGEGSVALRGAVVDRLGAAAERSAGLPPGIIERLRRLETVLGTAFVDDVVAGADGAGSAREHFTPGARVCFTGQAHAPDGTVWSRTEMNDLAQRLGLEPVASVTKKRCDVLIVAEPGTMSGKARKAAELGKPVLAAEEFFAWAASDG
ncbi:AAA family ATPase [Isoptericola sp. BMS4]|uniref:AAA family ATPase n=1 Tax=Isoptericola sp. BMS4 TaxID=2527875 RepID=UPI0014228883|nr:AAA family ATPase [Isoptericola sp. BMS4]